MGQLAEAAAALLQRAFAALTPLEVANKQGSTWLKNLAIALQSEVDPDDLPEDTAEAVHFFAECNPR